MAVLAPHEACLALVRWAHSCRASRAACSHYNGRFTRENLLDSTALSQYDFLIVMRGGGMIGGNDGRFS
jgi:hypothetical protein